jgi:inhibitor of KinA
MMIAPLGDSAVVVTLGANIDESTLVRVRSLAAALERVATAGIVDVVPAYTTVTVFYDISTAVANDEPPYEHVRRVIEENVAKIEHRWPDLIGKKLEGTAPSEMEIPVCYGGEHGPDLALVATQSGLSNDEVIALHCEPIYRVGAVGFTPGFPYLSGLPPRLATPRRATPRTSVPAGSVGIGGLQTGIYPLSTPGGWQLIGRTPLPLFEVDNPSPARLRVGDHVKFRPISAEEFATWK